MEKTVLDGETRHPIENTMTLMIRPIVSRHAEVTQEELGRMVQKVDEELADVVVKFIDLTLSANASRIVGERLALREESLEVTEARQIRFTLKRTGGNRRKAASILGLARSTLLSKIRRYGIPKNPFEEEQPA